MTRERKECVEFLEHLVHKRFNIEQLNEELSRFFGEDVSVVDTTPEDLSDGCEDFNLMAVLKQENDDMPWVFDIYYLPMRREGFDGATMYITEVSYEFN